MLLVWLCRRHLGWIVPLVVGAIWSVAAGSADGSMIRIPSEVEVCGERLRLGDLVPDTLPEWADVDLGYAPYPGHVRWLRRSEISAALHRAGLTWEDVDIPERILVRRGRQVLEPSLVRQAVLSYLQSCWPGFRVSTDEMELPREVYLPEGDVTVEVVASRQPVRFEHLTLRLSIRVDGRSYTSRWVSMSARMTGPVLVAARDLSYGDGLNQSSIRVEEKTLTDLEGVLTDPSEAIGAVAVCPIREGDVVRRKHLRAPVLVKRGEVVTLVARGSGFMVSATARSKDSGGAGDWIEVQNLESKQTVTARVVGTGRVEVRLREVR